MTNTCSGFVRTVICEIVNIRFRESSLLQVRQAPERLIASGYTHEEALALLGWALSHEMFEVCPARRGQSFAYSSKNDGTATKKMHSTSPWKPSNCHYFSKP